MCIQPTSSAFPPAVLFRLKFHDSIRFTLFCFQCHHYLTRLYMHSWIKYIPKHCLFLILCTHLVDLKVLRQIIRCDPDILAIIHMMMGIQIVLLHSEWLLICHLLRKLDLPGNLLHF